MHGRQLLSSGLNHAGYSDGLLRRAALYLACIAGDNSSIASSTPPSAVSRSYAAVICWKRSPLAAQPGLTSGCVCRARSRYACLMASGVAPRLRPSCARSLERDAAAIVCSPSKRGRHVTSGPVKWASSLESMLATAPARAARDLTRPAYCIPYPCGSQYAKRTRGQT